MTSIDVLERKVRTLETKLEVKDQRLEKRREENDEIRRQFRQEIERLTISCKALEAINAQLENDLQVKRQTIGDLERRVSSLMSERSRLRAALSTDGKLWRKGKRVLVPMEART